MTGARGVLVGSDASGQERAAERRTAAGQTAVCGGTETPGDDHDLHPHYVALEDGSGWWLQLPADANPHRDEQTP